MSIDKIQILTKLLRSNNIMVVSDDKRTQEFTMLFDNELKKLTQLQRKKVLQEFRAYPSLSLTQPEIRRLCDEIFNPEHILTDPTVGHTAVAKKLGVNRMTVARKRQKLGIKLIKPTPHVEDIKKYLKLGWDKKIIARKLEITVDHVNALIKKHDIK